MLTLQPSTPIGAALAQAAAAAAAAATTPLRDTATAYIDGDARWTWGQVHTQSDRLADSLLGLGLQRGQRMAIIGLNQIDWLLLFYAAAKIGVAVVGLSVRYRDSELAPMLADSQTRVVFTLAEHEGFDFIAMLSRLRPQLPALRQVVRIGGSGPGTLAGLMAETMADTVADTLADVGADVGADPSTRLAQAKAAVQAQDVAMVIYTSGTTGRPKGAGLTHRSLLASAAAQAAHTRLTPDDLFHMGNPLNHVGGITCSALAMLVGGGCTVLVAEFKADLMLRLMQQHRPTIVAGVPTMLTLLLMHARVDAVDFGAVRLVFSGGSNVDPVLLQRLAQRMPKATLMNIYGLSETSGGIVMTPWDASDSDRLASIGRPFDGAQLHIAGPDGSALPVGDVGELWFKGPGVVPGYIGEAAGAGFSADGWLQTGDLGAVDARGFITLKGRQKDMYIQGGFNVYPAEIEALLARHPQVLMAAVIGVADPVLGEVGRAYIIAQPGSSLAAADLGAWCAQHLADYKRPRHLVLRESLPMTPAGKIHKAALRDEGAASDMGIAQRIGQG